jgi:gamma-glutamyltranspeptidase/glutathione hydrolase
MNAPVSVPRVADFTCEKKPASGSRGMVVTNHPLASAAGAQILLAGGNAIDAAVASLFALTVAEPMMVGILGGGLSHIRLADGRHVVIDNLSTAPGKATADMYECLSDEIGKQRDTRDRENVVGAKAVAVPGALKGWCEALARFGTLPLAEVLQPAIGLAERGFVVTPYLSNCITDNAGDLARDPGLAAMLLPGGKPLQPGMRLVQADYAASLKLIAAEGPEALYGGKLGRALTDYMAANGGLIDQADLANYKIELREPIRGSYRGYEIIGPPPPSSSGVHITQMLNILEGYDIGALGFGSTDAVHLLAEALKIAFADRAVATADPAFVKVPVARLIDKAYADERRALIEMGQAKSWTAGIGARRIRQYDPCHRRGCLGQCRRDDADDQRAVRRLRADPRHRHDDQQLHVQFRSASGPCALDRAGQAGLHLDGADDGGEGRPSSPSRSACRVACASSPRPCRRSST